MNLLYPLKHIMIDKDRGVVQKEGEKTGYFIHKPINEKYSFSICTQKKSYIER